MDVTLRQLDHLVALAESGSFTGAARALHVAQPAVSQTIRAIERTSGVEVYDRTLRRLTAAGEILVARARRARSELDAASGEIERLRGVVEGHLRVGAIHWLEPFDMAQALGRFRAAYPGVRLSLVEADASVMLDRLQDAALDVVMHNRGPASDRPGTADA